MNSSVAPLRSSARRAGSPVGELLRAWRRTRRTSQLDLALKCSISQRHLSFVESGRARPSRAMVLRIAESLDVPLRERNVLLVAAGFASYFDERSLDTPEMLPVRSALRQMLTHHDPYPAVVVNRQWDILMANDAMSALFAALGWAPQAGATVNIVRATLTEPAFRKVIVNWDEVVRHLLARLQREAAASGSPALNALVEELRSVGDFADAWSDADWTRPPAPVLPVLLDISGQRLSLFSMIATFGTPMDLTTDELRVETFFPMDDASEQLLRRTAATPAR